jgi:hypothetical protein
MGGQAGDGMAGAGGAAPGLGPLVVINEVWSDGVVPQFPDSLELHNFGDEAADLSGWYFTDENPGNRYTFPAGTTLLPGAFIAVIQVVPGGTGGMTFGFNMTDAAFLYDSGDNAIDELDFSEHQDAGGRCPDGSGPFENGLVPTRGLANACN